jgi:uncharacterized membrane protein YdfJ with MMPL/SSD domain
MAGSLSNGSKEYEGGEGKTLEAENVVRETSNVESPSPATKLTLGQKGKRHCAKWWWLHLIVFCAIFLIIALPL